MQNPVPHIIKKNTFWVSHHRCLYWEEENTIIVADVHIGKTGHFRKEGIAVPQNIFKADLQRLMAQLYLFKAERLIIVGDFSHSKANKELELFLKWRRDFSLLHIDLVKGNHDILEDGWYNEANICLHEKDLVVNDFLFRHEDQRLNYLEYKNVAYTFSGHVHPGIKLKGQAKQSFMLPCFYFGRYNCILPAFSKFTGTHKIVPAEGDIIYAVTGEEIIKLG
jgi:DNA ligase-associated metallophosphoesterase